MGRSPNQRREEYMRRLAIANAKPHRKFHAALLDQLDQCADDDARRLILKSLMPLSVKKPARGARPAPEAERMGRVERMMRMAARRTA